MNKVDKLAVEIISDPAVKRKMKDFISRVHPEWETSDHPVMLATQAALANKSLEKEFLQKARNMFASDREFRAWMNSPNYNMHKAIGLRDMERLKGFEGFDDESTAHLNGVGEMFFDEAQVLGFDFKGKSAQIINLGKKIGGTKIGKAGLTAAGGGTGLAILAGKAAAKGVQKVIQNKQAKKAAKAEPVRDAVEYVGQAGVRDLQAKQQSYDRMQQNKYAADLAQAENNALASGVNPKYIDIAKSNANNADAMIDSVNKLTTAVSTGQAPGSPVSQPGSTSNTTLIIGGIALLAVVFLVAKNS